MRRRAAALLFSLVIVSGAAARGDAEEPGPRQVVETLHAKLVQVAAQAEALGQAGRVRALEPVVRATHAFEVMARDRVPARWGALDAAQRRQLAGMIGRLATSAYAGLYAKTAQLRYEVGGDYGYEAGVRHVPATRVDAAGTRRALIYRLQQIDGRWRIVHRMEDGQDPLPAQRKEYEALWARGGLPALLAGLETQLKRDAAPSSADATATQVVARLQDALLGVMRDAKQLGYRGRYQRLEPVVRETHYLAAIARLTVRRYWGQWSQAQHKEFFDTFARLSVANYASKFDGFSGERFARVEEKRVGKSTVVRSVLTKSDGEKIRFDYTMRKVKGRWRILNITVDGVSDLSTKQAEYGSVVSGGGLPALLRKLRDQIRRYESDQ